MFLKLGENIEISRIEDSDSCIPAVSEEILDSFRKIAAESKKIAPRADDFLYFSAVIIHAAEASAINDDGSPKKTSFGDQVKVSWDRTGDTWKWVTNDPSIRSYKNQNGDIFPESELIKVYKKWVGKPLCIDHKSNSVDHVRGFIVDTYYDRELKRIVALCALDKKNYPDLARKVSTGYSNSVSIGVAVGTAICTDCYKTARTETDFCQHMRNKNGYGEVNVDLNPIELSIVVNGADHKAKIKHIIAAANNLKEYVENKDKEIKKIAVTYSASLNVQDVDGKTGVDSHEANFNLKSTSLDKLKEEVDAAFLKLKEINEEICKKDTNESAYNQSSSAIAMDESEVSSGNNLELAPPSARFASTIISNDTNSVDEVKKITANIEKQLNQIKQSLDKILNISNKEENMSGSNEISKKGYYQGTEDPTPGQPKYTKEPQNEDLRENEDKHMLGQMDTGPVDGMHPGPDSVGMSELERKKMLARAESEERAMRRNAIVNLAKKSLEQRKEAYFQGGGGVNEPTPGKQKYPVDKLQYTLREDEDKQMVGQKPFPEVGAIDKLHPSPASADTADELKRKEMLRRAALRARFVKAANRDGSQNLGASAWEVFLGDKLLLTASVNDLSGGRSSILYDSIATKEFGTKLIEKIKIHGVDQVRSLVKSAQTPPPPPPPPPADSSAPPPPDSSAPPMEDQKLLENEDKSGDVSETATKLIDQMENLVSDLKEAVTALSGEKGEIPKEETGEPVPEMPMQESGMGATASTKTLNSLRRELNGALTQAMKEAVANLNDHRTELNMIKDIYDGDKVNSANKDLVQSIADDSINEAKTAVADSFKLMTAFVKYARGTQAIVKRAQMQLADDEDSDLMRMLDEDLGDEPKAGHQTEYEPEHEYDPEIDLSPESDLGVSTDLDSQTESLEDLEEPEEELDKSEFGSLFDEPETEEDEDDINDAMAQPKDPASFKPGEAGVATNKPNEFLPIAQASLNTKEGRMAYRAKLASDTLKMSPHFHEAHPKGGFTTQLDVKPSDDLAKVEDIEEVHDAMMEVAKAPPKVRKEAEAIHMLISEGKLDPKDLDALVAEGLDAAAVKYYKQYYGEVDGGSEFASELVKEHVKAQMEEELNKFKIKMAAAYELTHDMVDRGLCYNDRAAISAQVDEIMKFSDENFDSLKRVVARHSPIRKEASKIPQVGLIGSGEIGSVAASDDSLYAQLSDALSSNTRRMF